MIGTLDLIAQSCSYNLKKHQIIIDQYLIKLTRRVVGSAGVVVAVETVGSLAIHVGQADGRCGRRRRRVLVYPGGEHSTQLAHQLLQKVHVLGIGVLTGWRRQGRRRNGHGRRVVVDLVFDG